MSVKSGTCLWPKQKAPARKEYGYETERNSSLEDDIVVCIFAENICRFLRFSGGSGSSGRFWVRCLLCCCLLAGSKDLGICGSNISLLLARDLLQAVEFLSIKLIEFRVNVCRQLASAKETKVDITNI